MHDRLTTPLGCNLPEDVLETPKITPVDLTPILACLLVTHDADYPPALIRELDDADAVDGVVVTWSGGIPQENRQE